MAFEGSVLPTRGLSRLAARRLDYVTVSVTDSGKGMPPEVTARAFEPFYTTKPRGSGTGLGLATVYGIVKQSDGYIALTSRPGSGTSVTIYLPATAEQIAEQPAPESAPLCRRGHTILVVEDEDSVRTLVQRILERNGYNVLPARSGDDALEAAATYGGKIALALTDVVMPGLSGRDFADRATEADPDLKIVFMSGYPDEVSAKLGVLTPDTHYLQKPFDEAAVLRILARALDAPPPHQASTTAPAKARSASN